MNQQRFSSSGRIELLYGCMFGGKTQELLRRLSECAPQEVQAYKHSRDTRYGMDEIVSHAGSRFPAYPVQSSRQLMDRIEPTTRIVGIDEGHFFDLEFQGICRQLRERELRVIITALQPNSWGIPFPLVNELIEIADCAEHMFARCALCGQTADRTQRTTPIIAGQIVGGPEAFEPRCVKCWAAPAGRSIDS